MGTRKFHKIRDGVERRFEKILSASVSLTEGARLYSPGWLIYCTNKMGRVKAKDFQMVRRRSSATYFHTQDAKTFNLEQDFTRFVTERQFTEKFHKRTIEEFMDPDHRERLAMALGDTFVGSVAYKSAMDKLKQIMKHDNGDTEYIHVVNDYHIRADGLGRLYPKLQGYTTLNRSLRGPLGGEKYWYLDMKNAQPSIIVGLNACDDRSKDFCPALDKYCKRREYYLKKLMTAFGCCWKTAKCLPLIILFGGSFRTWIGDHESQIKHPNAMLPTIFTDLQREYESWQELVFKDIDVSSWDKKKKDHMLSIMLHTIERQAIEHAIKFLTAKGYIVGSVIHDGFLIEKNSGPKPNLHEIDKHVDNQNSLGLNFDWEEFP
jgi:hypothetical protein